MHQKLKYLKELRTMVMRAIRVNLIGQQNKVEGFVDVCLCVCVLL